MFLHNFMHLNCKVQLNNNKTFINWTYLGKIKLYLQKMLLYIKKLIKAVNLHHYRNGKCIHMKKVMSNLVHISCINFL